MHILEFLEMLALVLLVPFLLFIIAPFSLAWVVGQISRWVGACL